MSFKRPRSKARKYSIGCSLSVCFLERSPVVSLLWLVLWFQFLNLEVFTGLAFALLTWAAKTLESPQLVNLTTYMEWKSESVSCSAESNSLGPHGLQLPRLFGPWDSPGRILEWVAVPFSRGSSQPRGWTQVSCIASRLFTVWATGREKKKLMN